MSLNLVPVAATTLLAVIIGAPNGARANDPSFVLIDAGWEAFAESADMGSFAWAGEDEGFFAGPGPLGSSRFAVQLDDAAVDPALLTAIPAPEPPALVLAGLAFGGVMCGRSLFVRRRSVGGDSDSESDSPRG